MNAQLYKHVESPKTLGQRQKQTRAKQQEENRLDWELEWEVT